MIELTQQLITSTSILNATEGLTPEQLDSYILVIPSFLTQSEVELENHPSSLYVFLDI